MILMTEEIRSLLAEIERYTAATGIAETPFGRLAVNDGKFVGRLRRGRRCWPETIEKARDFIASASEPAA